MTVQRLCRTAISGLAAFLIMTLSGCGAGKNSPSNAGVAVRTVPVEIAVAARKNLTVTKTYSGPLEGEEQANIVAKISERLTGIHVRVGEAVRAGGVIISLDRSGTSSQYYQAAASFKNAEKTLERMKSLYAEGAISLQSLDAAQTAHDVARANFDAASSAVELRTPIAGFVTAINVSLGDLASPGALLATIARIDRMRVTFNMNESDAAGVAVGQKVTVSSDARPDAKGEGRIIQLSKSADVRSRSFEMKALFPNTADRWFKPGMFCRVNLVVSPREESLVVPNGAIQSDGVTNRVFVIRGGRAFQQTVEVGVSDGESTAILRGLADRDTVATVGVNNLKDSTHVMVVMR